MLPGAALELKTGEPPAYLPGAAILYAIVLLALFLTPLEWSCTLATLILGGLALYHVISRRNRGQRFAALRVHADLSLSLLSRDRGEVPVAFTASPWVSRRLIVLPVHLVSGSRERIVISRVLNEDNAFRRFTVICRFGFAVSDREGQNAKDPHKSTHQHHGSMT